jgi:hypothetical protein
MPLAGFLPSTPVDRRHALWTLFVAAAALAPVVGYASEPYHLSYTVERGGGGPTRINGRLLNEGPLDMFDVYVTAEAIDGTGKVVARGITFVSASIPPRGLVSFAISVPPAPTATTFQVRVSSFRHGIGQQTG